MLLENRLVSIGEVGFVGINVVIMLFELELNNLVFVEWINFDSVDLNCFILFLGN